MLGWASSIFLLLGLVGNILCVIWLTADEAFSADGPLFQVMNFCMVLVLHVVNVSHRWSCFSFLSVIRLMFSASHTLIVTHLSFLPRQDRNYPETDSAINNNTPANQAGRPGVESHSPAQHTSCFKCLLRRKQQTGALQLKREGLYSHKQPGIMGVNIFIWQKMLEI